MQREMFSTGPYGDLVPTDPNCLNSDKARITGQNWAILARLRGGPATAVELSAISLKYTSRLSDLRKHGYRIKNTRTPDGGSIYTLEES